MRTTPLTFTTARWAGAALATALLTAACAGSPAGTTSSPPSPAAAPTTAASTVDQAVEVDQQVAAALTRFRTLPPADPAVTLAAAGDGLAQLGGLDAARWAVIGEVAPQLAGPLELLADAPPASAAPAPPLPGSAVVPRFAALRADAPAAGGAAAWVLSAMAASSGADRVAREALTGAAQDGGRIRVGDPAAESFVDGHHRVERSFEATTEADGHSVAVRSSGATDAQVCPDADGRVVVTVTSAVRLDLRGPLPGFADLRSETRFEGQLAEDGTVVRTRVDTRLQSALGDGSNDGSIFGGSFVEATTRADVPAALSDLSLTADHYVDVTVLRRSSAVGLEAATYLALTQALVANSAASPVMTAVEAYWRSGACVDVRLTPAAGPRGLALGSEVSVTVKATARDDGSPTGGVARAALADGGVSVAPTAPVAVPGTVTYTAPSQNLSGGTVAVEVSSRRGIGRTTLVLVTGGVWRFDTTWQGFRVTGTVCTGSPQPWELQVSGSPGTGATLTGRLVVTFPPGDTSSGNFSFDGTSSGGGMSFTNTSSGTVTFHPDPEGGTGATLTLYPEQGNVTNGSIGRAGFAGEPELFAEQAEGSCA